jgi:signal transduction histidine kinase
MQPSHLHASESPASALVTHLQSSAELDKASLVKELHDDLGGLMVAAVMDVAWAEQYVSSPLARGRLARVCDTLRSAIDIERRIIEELRPSLLDNVGLFAALSWELKQTCARSGLQCSERYPHSELRFTPEASIALFRIAQEALAISSTHDSVTKEELCVSTECETITLRFANELRFANDESTSPPGVIDRDTPLFASMVHRIEVLGGSLHIESSPHNGTAMTISIPVSRALLPSG